MTDHGNLLLGWDREIDVEQNLSVWVVTEGHMLETDMTLLNHKIFGVGFVLNLEPFA